MSSKIERALKAQRDDQDGPRARRLGKVNDPCGEVCTYLLGDDDVQPSHT